MVKTFVFLFLFPLFVFCAARPVTNNARVTIREYDVPTPNSRPHDPAVAPDNALWYTGQLAALIVQNRSTPWSAPARRRFRPTCATTFTRVY